MLCPNKSKSNANLNIEAYSPYHDWIAEYVLQMSFYPFLQSMFIYIAICNIISLAVNYYFLFNQQLVGQVGD